MKHTITVMLTLILCTLIVAGCSSPGAQPQAPVNAANSASAGSSTAAAPPSDKTIRIGVTFKSIKQEFDVTMKAGIEETAAALGIELVVVDANFDMQRQRSAVDDFVTQKMDAIIMSPVNSTGSAAMIESAQAAGVPVITIDIGSDEGVERCYVASDNIMGGTIIGEYLVNELKITSGKLIVLDLKEDISVRERCQGFLDVVGGYPDIEVIGHMDGGGNRDESLNIAESVLQGNPDVNIIFGGIGDMAVGVAKAMENSNRSDITLLGYDADYDVLKLIESGECKGITAQFPYNIGKTAVETAIQLAGGDESVPEKIQIPVEVVSPDNLGDFLVEK